jgi:predicted acyltransferase
MASTATAPVAASATGAIAPVPTRIVSIDALRGFTMFWIMGSGGLFKAMRAFGDVQPAKFFSRQLEHVAWGGFHFEDLIFPMFVFIAGASLVFSLTKTIEREGRAAAARRIIVRALMLWALGIFYYGGFSRGLEGVRWVGVLQRIAFAYLGAGLLFLALKPRGLIVACLAILVGYWALMTFVPVPDVGPGQYAERMNLADYLDRQYLPGKRYSGDHDPEGLLSNLPAVATCLFGVFAGLLVQSAVPGRRKVALLCAAGAVLIAAGYAWSPFFPIIKKIWTSSYVLLAAGWSAFFLGVFYLLIDVFGWRRWAQPFVWIGMNAITVYLMVNIVDVSKLAARFTGGSEDFLNASLHAGVGDLLTAFVSLSFGVLLARFLYHRGIFLRV